MCIRDSYPDDVPPDVKTRRLNEIIALQNELSLKSNRNDIGKVYPHDDFR